MKKLNYYLLFLLCCTLLNYNTAYANSSSIEDKIAELQNFENDDYQVTITNIACDFGTIRFDILVTTNTNDNFFIFVSENQFTMNGVPMTSTTLEQLEFGQTHSILQFNSDFSDFTVNLLNEVEQPLCDEPVVISCPNNAPCDIVVTATGDISIQGLPTGSGAKLFDSDFNTVWECADFINFPCEDDVLLEDQPEGDYFLSINSDFCNDFISISNAIPECIVDNDNDGVCAAEDCDDNNPNLPASVNSNCDDGDPDTSFDQIQEDGCTCEGVFFPCTLEVELLSVTCNPPWLSYTIDISNDENPLGNSSIAVFVGTGPNNSEIQYLPYNGITTVTTYFGTNPTPSARVFNTVRSDDCAVVLEFTACNTEGCNISTSTFDDSVNILSLTEAENAKVFDADFNVVFECAPWNGNPCTDAEIVTGLTAGQYFVSIQSDQCDEWIPITVEDGGSDDNDGDGVPADEDCDDNDPNVPAAFGTPCDDGDAFTDNDIIQLDGCNCLGTSDICTVNAQISDVSCTSTTLIFTASVSISPSALGWVIEGEPELMNANDLLGLHPYGTPIQFTVDISNATSPYTFAIYDPDLGASSCIEFIEIECPTQGCSISTLANNGTITIEGLTGAENTKIFDADFNTVFECNPWNGNLCTGTEIATGLPTGDYFVSIQSDICDLFLTVNVDGGGGCPDADNDGTCDAADCEPNNPNLPAITGTSCDDNNPNTENDIYQSGGCECAGTPIDGACNVNFTETDFGQITITGLTSAENTKIFDSNANSSGIIWECNPWSTTCSNTEIIDGLIPGAQYYLSVQSDNCSEWIPFELNMASFGNNSQLNEVNTLDKFSIAKVFPNPATNEAFVKIESTFDGEMTLEIYDVIGQRQATNITSIENGMNTIELNVNNLNAGVYHLFVRNKNGQTKSLRFVKIRD